MPSPSQIRFADDLNRLRNGDDAAVQAFLDTYEPYLRRSIRRRLARTSLQAIADSTDICQSAMVSFFVRMADGQFDIANRQAMQRLLMMIAQRKLWALRRREFANRRDRKRTIQWDSRADQEVALRREPQRDEICHNVIDSALAQLPRADRQLLEFRRRGLDWNQIAERSGLTAAAARQRLSRALRQVADRVRSGLSHE